MDILVRADKNGIYVVVERPNPDKHMKPFYVKEHGTYWEVIIEGQSFDDAIKALTDLVTKAANS